MEFQILGPPRVIGKHGEVALGGRRQRLVLAMLMVNANRLVPLDQLVDAVWGDRPPSTAKRQIQNSVATLRRLLAEGEAREPVIVSDGPGYRAMPGPDELDAQVFENQVAAADQLAAQDRSGEAVAQLRSALRLWRGPALLGLSGHAVETAAARLDEQRLAALEHRIGLELKLGRPDDVIGEITELVATHPLREPFVGLQMLALHQAGRQADALQAYHRLRKRLAEELGVDPGASLQHLHTSILTDDAFAERPPGLPVEVTAGTPLMPVPAQLPTDVAAFTGRRDHLKALDELFGEDAGRGSTAVVVTAITGTAGVGKTSLAVHWGHRAKDRFPDGQLYINLRGYAVAPPTPPAEALLHFLHGLGVPPDRIPLDPQTAAGLYRSMLADRKVLVVLDNAANADQVRPLLPGSPGCLVLVTSRDRLSGLVAYDGAHRLTLDVLDADEAYTLLVRILGPDRVAAEPAATADLAVACAHLPLAMRIAATNVADNPRSSIGDQVRALCNGDRLATLQADDDEPAGVRRAFDLSYQALDRDGQRLFRLFGLIPARDITAGAAAALTATDVSAATRQLNRLAAAHLMNQSVPGRYVSHDLLRQYAGDRARDAESAEECRDALQRLDDWYVYWADAAAKLLYPHRLRLPVPAVEAPASPVLFDNGSTALDWLEAERANLVAVIRHAAENGRPPTAWLLADALRGYFQLRMYTMDWEWAVRAALTAAEASGDLRAQAATLLGVGDLNLRRSRFEEAIEPFTRALALCEQTDWVHGQAAALGYLGSAFRDCGRVRQAADCHSRALVLYRAIGSSYGEAVALDCLGRSCRQLGLLTEAAGYYERALALYRAIGSRQGEGLALHDLGQICQMRGQLDDAMAHLNNATKLAREISDRAMEPYNLSSLARVHCDAGRPQQAIELARAAVSVAGDQNDPRTEAEALNTLAVINHHLGRHGQAIENHRRALHVSGASGDRYPEVEALIGLADAHQALGDRDNAVDYAERALAIAREVGFRLIADQALALLAPAGPARTAASSRIRSR